MNQFAVLTARGRVERVRRGERGGSRRKSAGATACTFLFSMEPIGSHHFHGFSPALDLQQVSRTALGAVFPAGEGPLRILLLQPGDPRSILKTIAQRFRHSTRPLHVRPREEWGGRKHSFFPPPRPFAPGLLYLTRRLSTLSHP